ncbi:MAG: HEPN domain-containing protein [bacterium]
MVIFPFFGIIHLFFPIPATMPKFDEYGEFLHNRSDMARRTKDWLRQAERDLQHARNSLASADYEWACFAAQQSAEKAVKALHQHLGREAIGHSVLKLLRDLGEELGIEERLLKIGADLDKYYIPTRYPNGFFSGAPMDYFHREDAEEAIMNAEEILRFVKGKING